MSTHACRCELQLLTDNCPFEPQASLPEHYKCQEPGHMTLASTHLDNSSSHKQSYHIQMTQGSQGTHTVCLGECLGMQSSGIRHRYLPLYPPFSHLHCTIRRCQGWDHNSPESPGFVFYCYTNNHKLSRWKQHIFYPPASGGKRSRHSLDGSSASESHWTTTKVWSRLCSHLGKCPCLIHWLLAGLSHLL